MPESGPAVAARFTSVDAAREAFVAIEGELASPGSVTVVSSTPLPEGALPVRHEHPPFPREAAIAGAFGIAAAVALTAGTVALYPISTGPMPLYPLPPYAIVSYELMMLFAMVATAVGCVLRLGRNECSAELWQEVSSSGGVGLSVRCRDAGEALRVSVRLEELGGVLVVGTAAAGDRALWRPARSALLVVGLAAVLSTVVLPAAAGYLGWPWNLMRRQVAIRAQELPPIAAPAGIVPFPGPDLAPAGVDRTGRTPPTAGVRGLELYASQCAFCHGADGRGGGPVAPRMSVPPSDLTSWGVQYRTAEDLQRFLAEAPGPMPPFAHRLRNEERRLIVEYLQTAFRPGSPPPWQIAASDDPAQRGKTLYEALQCGRCHEEGSPREAPGIPPDLSHAGSEYRPEWLRAYLAAPYPWRWRDQDVRPEIWMPAFYLSPEELDGLVAYLSSRTNPGRFPPVPAAPRATADEVRQGRRLFGEYQCLGCHELSGEGTRIGPDLTHVGGRLLSSYIHPFIQHPQEIIPGTSMKDFGLWEDEALALTRYLETLE